MATRGNSPLRYPGGKAALYGPVSSILAMNRLKRGHYVEPFAGGCGLALTLLYDGHISDIHVNDIDPSIWAFWHSALHLTEEFADKVMSVEVTVEEWRRQRTLHQRMDTADPLALGFAAFFLNRTNRSGIIKEAGVIGGLSQSGQYKIDCRFNRPDLARRIRRIAKYKGRIHLYNMDAIELLQQLRGVTKGFSFVYADPPYFNKGAQLYTNFYKPSDHKALADIMLGLPCPWIVTYDNVPAVTSLYRYRRQFAFDIAYSLDGKRTGTEVVIASKGLKLPSELQTWKINKPQYRAPKYRPH